MSILNLPTTTSVNRIVPKSAFDKHTTAKRKKEFSEKVEKMRWMNKLSFATINLPAYDIKEVQVFEVQLKRKADVSAILDIIDRAIPYSIIFVVIHDDEFFLSASQKHPHPLDENISAIDWTFKTDWLQIGASQIQLILKESIDFVFTDFCKRISGNDKTKISLAEIISRNKRIRELEKRKRQLEQKLASCKQFNQKLDIHKELSLLNKELSEI